MKDVKTIRKKFCSDLCRVNFNNETKSKKEPIDERIKEYFSKVTPDEIIAHYESLGYTFKIKQEEPKIKLDKYFKVVNNTSNEVKQKVSNMLDKLDLENKHPLWKQGDPKEKSNAFYFKYGCFSYEELENLKK